MELDPKLREFLDEFNKKPPMYLGIPPYVVRAGIGTDKEPPRKAQTSHRFIPVEGGEVTARIYTPEGDGPFPVCLFFHGGGFVGGSILGYDYPLHEICLESKCIIVSVDYRLAPENKFPTCFEDCYAALVWTHENAASFNGDPDNIALSGVSAGGTLTAAVSLMARDRKGPKIKFAAIMYAVLDMGHTLNTKSQNELAEGYYHNMHSGAVFDAYLIRTEEDKLHPFLSPVLIEDLSNLPKTLVMTMEWDLLRDEGEYYANRLKEAGNDVVYYMAPGVIHNSFIWAEWCPAAKERVNDYFTKALHDAMYE